MTFGTLAEQNRRDIFGKRYLGIRGFGAYTASGHDDQPKRQRHGWGDDRPARHASKNGWHPSLSFQSRFRDFTY
jgi:hypothetical protein